MRQHTSIIGRALLALVAAGVPALLSAVQPAFGHGGHDEVNGLLWHEHLRVVRLQREGPGTCSAQGKLGYASEGACVNRDQGFSGVFRYDGHGYDINRLYLDGTTLIVRFDGYHANRFGDNMKLVVGGTEFAFGSANGTNHQHVTTATAYARQEFRWTNSGLSWNAGQRINLRITATPTDNVPPYFIGGYRHIDCTIQEHEPAGAEVCGAQRVQAIDANPGDTLTYSLSGRDADGFRIDAAIGVVSLGSASSDLNDSAGNHLNRSTCGSRRYKSAQTLIGGVNRKDGSNILAGGCYTFQVRVADQGGAFDVRTIYARIMDRPEETISGPSHRTTLTGVRMGTPASGSFRLHWNTVPPEADGLEFQTGVSMPIRRGNRTYYDPVHANLRQSDGTYPVPQIFWYEGHTRLSEFGRGGTTGALHRCRDIDLHTRRDIRRARHHPTGFGENSERRSTGWIRVRARGRSVPSILKLWSAPILFHGCGINVTPSNLVADPPVFSARFTNPASPHDGTAFDARLDLGIEPAAGFSYKVFQGDQANDRPSVLQVTNGTVQRARRDGENQNRKWVITILPGGNEAVTITLPATTDCLHQNAICTDDGTMLAEAITKVVPGPSPAAGDSKSIVESGNATPLTATFSSVPAEHDGSTEFSFQLKFSENLKATYSYKTMRDTSLSVTQGGQSLSVTEAKRLTQGSNQGWRITIVPSGNGDIAINVPATPDCTASNATCTSDGRGLSSSVSDTVPGPARISVADAQVQEAADATLDFVVSLNRATGQRVTVNYATHSGTATAASDFTATSGTLTFLPGETSKTVSVAVLDDTIDEGSGENAETMTLRLTNATGAVLADAEAIGRINNADPLQRAWLARFGRTVATHVTDAIGARVRGTPAQGSHVTVGEYRLPVGQTGRDARSAAGRPDSGATPASASALLQGVAGVLGVRPEAGAAPPASPWLAGPEPRLGQSRPLNVDLRQVLRGSAFRLALNGAAPGATIPRLTAWGRFAGTTFDGRDGDLSLDGDVFTGTVGVDGAWDRWLAGVAVAHSRGKGSFTRPGMADRGRGALEQTLTSLHPYLRYAVTERLAVWGQFGYGWGELDVELADGQTVETDTTLVMGAFGGRGILLAATESGGVQVATRTDAMLTRTSADAAANSVATDADAHRLRLILEGSRGFTWANGRRFTPTVELGLRHDWGDAETGFGLEVGGRVQYADPRVGLTVEAQVRGLLAHEDADYQEWGASGTLRLAPGAAGQGVSLTLAPAWGVASSGVDGLWSRQTAQGLAPQGRGPAAGGRLAAEVSYGVAVVETELVTPYAGTVLADGADRTYRVGLRWTGVTGLAVHLEGQHQEPVGARPVNQGLRLQTTWGF